MNKIYRQFFLPEKRKLKTGGPLGMGYLGFMAPELVQLAYALFTALIIFFTWTNLEDPQSLMWERLTFVSGTLALWVVYQLWQCQFVLLLRFAYLLYTLAYWYPDTYAINSQFPCLDHVFAAYEQNLFGMQPALRFSEAFPSAVVSEAMYCGYLSYYLFFVVTVFYVFFRHFAQAERVTYIIMAGFFICYVIFLFLPVTGPQYYYLAVGTEEIAQGTFPALEHYFREHTEAITMPGWNGGIFYHLCELAHQTGERPTAAFPSSHVAIATLVMAILLRMRLWKNLLFLAIPYIFLCLSTVYIMAHYAIDALAGFLFGILLFFLLGGMKLHKV